MSGEDRLSLRDLPEEQLAARCRNGDVEAFDEACRRHVRRLYGVAWQMLGSRESAWDATQETLLTAWKNRRSFRGDGSVLAWFRGILVRVCWAVNGEQVTQQSIPAGLPVRIKLLQALGTDTAAKDQTVTYQVVQNVVVDGVTLIAAGARGTAHLVAVKVGGRSDGTVAWSWTSAP